MGAGAAAGFAAVAFATAAGIGEETAGGDVMGALATAGLRKYVGVAAASSALVGACFCACACDWPAVCAAGVGAGEVAVGTSASTGSAGRIRNGASSSA